MFPIIYEIILIFLIFKEIFVNCILIFQEMEWTYRKSNLS